VEVDVVQPFLLESSGIRGDLVRLGPAVDHVLTRHAYPAPVADLLGQMLAMAAALSSMMKFEGLFTLQTKGDGPVGMLVADATSGGHLRGYAGFDEKRLAALPASGTSAPPRIADILGRGYLAFTVDQGPQTERYQGIVELGGETLTDSLLHYFRQSEQVRTGLIVTAAQVGGAWRAAGLLLQTTPDHGPDHGPGAGSGAGAALDTEEDWRRAMMLQATCTREELLDFDLPINDLLYRLFHEEGVRVFRRRPLVARCRCSRARLEETLRSLPRAEIENLRIDGEVVVTCQFCNKSYRFDDDALERIYAP